MTKEQAPSPMLYHINEFAVESEFALPCDAAGGAVMLERGECIAALGMRAGLDPFVVTMLRTGEATGNLDAVLEKVAEYYHQDAALRLHQFKIVAGVAATLTNGLCVLLIWLGGRLP